MSAKYVYSLDNSQPMNVKLKTGAAIKAGDILAIASGVVSAVAAAAAAGTIIGIAMADADAGAIAPVMVLNDRSVVRVPYIGTTKTSLVEADRITTAFDWDATHKKLNLDDTTGGFLKVVAFNNTDKTADVLISVLV